MSMDDLTAFLCGQVTGLLSRYLPDSPIDVTSVEPIIDTEGNYSSIIRIRMGSGRVYLLHLTEVEE